MKQLAIFILIGLLLYYGTKFFVRYLLPWLLMRFFEKQMDNMNRARDFDEERHTKEGNIKREGQKQHKTKTDDKSFGEYIDFEEINDNDKNKSDE